MAPGDTASAEPEPAAAPEPAAVPSTALAPAATAPAAAHPGGSHSAVPNSVVPYRSRVSLAQRHGTGQQPALPFTVQQLTRLDEALTFAGRETGVAFSVYLGELGEDSRTRAEEMLASLGAAAAESVLIAVSPGERVVELVTGTSVQRRVTDRAARLAVTAMVASFCEGDLAGGLVSALRMLADQAGPAAH